MGEFHYGHLLVRVDFNVPVRTEGDVYARYLVRVAEMRESVKICRQALERITPTGAFAIDDPRITPPPKDRVYTEMEALIQHFLIYSQGFTVPAGEAYVPIEGPRGEHGFSIVSDGSNRPHRIKLRAPSFYACQGLPKLIIGGMIAAGVIAPKPRLPNEENGFWPSAQREASSSPASRSVVVAVASRRY